MDNTIDIGHREVSGTVFASAGEPFKRPTAPVIQKHDSFVERRQSVTSPMMTRRSSRSMSISTPSKSQGPVERDVSIAELDGMFAHDASADRPNSHEANVFIIIETRRRIQK